MYNSTNTFFMDTCDGGAEEFTWVHPRTQSTGCTFRFVGQPTVSAADGGLYQVNFDVELMP